jgi:hypothetical protein
MTIQQAAQSIYSDVTIGDNGDLSQDEIIDRAKRVSLTSCASSSPPTTSTTNWYFAAWDTLSPGRCWSSTATPKGSSLPLEPDDERPPRRSSSSPLTEPSTAPLAYGRRHFPGSHF